MSDFSLKAIFGMDSTGFRNELKSLSQSMSDFASNWLTQVVGAGALLSLADQAGKLAVSIKDVALSLGIAATSYQALQYQAQSAGVSQEAFDKGLAKVKESVIEAAKGNAELSEVFANLGLNARYLLTLPLDKQYEAIAKAVTGAANQADAFNDVVKIFGGKVGPEMLESLHSLSNEGLQGVIDQANAAGQVMNDGMITALANAMQAIDNFKKKVVVSMGKILVDFDSEDGLLALGARFLAITSGFGGKLLDVVVQAGQLVTAVIGGAFQGVINNFRNGYIDAFEAITDSILKHFPGGKILVQIDDKALDKLRTSGDGIADSIARAIAATHATTFEADWSKFYNDLADGFQRSADALNKPIQALADAGKPIAQDIELAAQSLTKATVPLKQSLDDFRKGINEMIGFNPRGASQFNDASDTALRQIIQDNTNKIHQLNDQANLNTRAGGRPYDVDVAIASLQQENINAQGQLSTRNAVRNGYAGGGINGAYNAVPNIDPLQVDKLVQQFAQLQTPSTETANSLKTISRQLSSAGFGQG